MANDSKTLSTALRYSGAKISPNGSARLQRTAGDPSCRTERIDPLRSQPKSQSTRPKHLNTGAMWRGGLPAEFSHRRRLVEDPYCRVMSNRAAECHAAFSPPEARAPGRRQMDRTPHTTLAQLGSGGYSPREGCREMQRDAKRCTKGRDIAPGPKILQNGTLMARPRSPFGRSPTRDHRRSCALRIEPFPPDMSAGCSGSELHMKDDYGHGRFCHHHPRIPIP